MSLSAAVELDAMTQALLMKAQDYAEFHAAFTEGRDPRLVYVSIFFRASAFGPSAFGFRARPTFATDVS